MSSRRYLTSLLAVGLANTLACGSLSSQTDSPSTLGVIRGTIASNSVTAPAASLATAIVWFQQLPNSTTRESADSVPVTGSFPASFSIDLTSLPPASAMMDLGTYSGDPAVAGVNIAFGLVVAYDDRNGNGRLDLVDQGASQYIDAIEGAAEQALVFFADKPIPASYFATSATIPMGLDGSTPRAGYSLLQTTSNYCFATGDAGAAGGACTEGAQWLPIDSPITLTLGVPAGSSTDAEQELMCAAGPNTSSADDISCGSGPCPATVSVADFGGPLPSASDPNVLCLDPNDFQYTSACTITVAGVCQAVDIVCTQQVIVTLDPAESAPIAPPAGWPCTLQPAPSPAYLASASGQPRSSGSSGSSN